MTKFGTPGDLLALLMSRGFVAITIYGLISQLVVAPIASRRVQTDLREHTHCLIMIEKDYRIRSEDAEC